MTCRAACGRAADGPRNLRPSGCDPDEKTMVSNSRYRSVIDARILGNAGLFPGVPNQADQVRFRVAQVFHTDHSVSDKVVFFIRKVFNL